MNQETLKKVTTRSAVTILLTVYLGFVIYYTLTHDIAENPVVMLVLGILSTNFATVVIFYYRKAQAKEST